MTLVINEKQYLVGYPTFLAQVEKLKAFADGNFHCENITQKECPGWVETLYEASTLGCYVTYSQTREWVYCDNGISGVGETLEEAVAKWRIAYNRHLMSV